MENRTHIIFFILIIALGVSSCDLKNERKQLRIKTALLEQELNERDSAFNQILTVMDLAESKINEIKERENIVTLESEGEINPNQESRIIEDISLIDQLLNDTQAQLNNLSGSLKESNIELNAFKRRVARLNDQLKERENSIEELKKTLVEKNLEIKDLNQQVTTLSEDVEMQAELIALQEQTISSKVKELNNAFFIVDDEKALLEKGLISKEGGLLGMGRVKGLEPDIDTKKLQMIDISKVSQIDINAKKFEIITEHPSESYVIVEDDDQVSHIKIKDSGEFWKISKFLVISRKG